MNKVIVAIAAITILEGVAIWQGVNGVLFGLAITAIAGLGGYSIGRRSKPK